MWIERKALHVQESSTLEFYAIQPLETRRWCVWVENHDVVMIPHTTSILLSLVTISNVVQRPYSNLPIKIAAFSYLLKKWRANWCLLREPLSINQVPWIRSIYHIYHFLESDSEIELEPIRNAATLTSSTHSSRIETHVVRGGGKNNAMTIRWPFPMVGHQWQQHQQRTVIISITPEQVDRHFSLAFRVKSSINLIKNCCISK